MSTHPRSAALLHGAIVSVDAVSKIRTEIPFRYNPEALSRTLEPRIIGGESGQMSRGVRFTGAAEETIEAELVLDASDQLEAGRAPSGVLPQLNALELLLHPESNSVINSQALLDKGMIEIGPYVAPLTLFVWGQHRTIPVLITRLSTREELFDPQLNPVRATVSISMRVLSYSDLAPGQSGYDLFLAFQQNRERNRTD